MGKDLTVKNRNTTPLSKAEPQLGEWYWVKQDSETDPWLGCIMKIGSNFVELHAPHSDHGGYNYERIHFDEFHLRLIKEEDPGSIIKEKIEYWQYESKRLLREVRDLTMRLGLNPRHYLTDTNEEAQNPTALMVISGREDINAYKKDLVEAKEKTLPDLFKAIENANEQLCKWMLATTMEIQSSIIPMKQSIAMVDNRIFTVSLYAGLVEQVIKISDGNPAGLTDKLHVMQRRLYMDEECLLNYNSGGMEFADINQFDSWMAKPENRDRILPFPRTIVAMRVRRTVKERDWEGNILQAFINLNIENSDKFTFLYIRNGDQLYRLSCEMEFGKMIFPNKNGYDPLSPKMVKMFSKHIDKMMSVNEYEVLLAEYNENIKKKKQWAKDNPKKHQFLNPYYSHTFNPHEWKPFDKNNLYYDECMDEIASQIREYNRIALIIQGLFDRSLVFHPHLPVKSWETGGFDKAIKLVYDGEMTIHYKETPDFEEYRNKKNESLQSGSIVTGQQIYWEEREAQKENKRLDNNWRHKSTYRYKTYKPYGNPGPGLVAKISTWKKKSKVAIFTWERERQNWRYHGSGSDLIKVSIAVPASRLFNISTYQSGEYLRFFNDPRTREQYLKWAPLLLTAEDYHAASWQGKDK